MLNKNRINLILHLLRSDFPVTPRFQRILHQKIRIQFATMPLRWDLRIRLVYQLFLRSGCLQPRPLTSRDGWQLGQLAIRFELQFRQKMFLKNLFNIFILLLLIVVVRTGYLLHLLHFLILHQRIFHRFRFQMLGRLLPLMPVFETSIKISRTKSQPLKRIMLIPILLPFLLHFNIFVLFPEIYINLTK